MSNNRIINGHHAPPATTDQILQHARALIGCMLQLADLPEWFDPAVIPFDGLRLACSTIDAMRADGRLELPRSSHVGHAIEAGRANVELVTSELESVWPNATDVRRELVECFEHGTTPALIDHHARSLAKAHCLQQAAEYFEGKLKAAQRGDVEALEGSPFSIDLPNKFAPVPIGELIGKHRELRSPIIDGVLRRGETLNIIAPPKVGKSWLAYSLALSVVTGRKWLDSFWCNAGSALLVDNELHPETLAHRIPAVADALSIRRDEYADRLKVIPLRGHVRSIGELTIFDHLKPGQFDLVILDSWYRFLPAGASENDNASMRDAYNMIDRIADRLGCGFVLIHHSSKGNQSEKSVTDVGAGAGAQSRAADTHLILRPHEDDGRIVLDAVTRSHKPLDPIVLTWNFPIWTRDSNADPTALARPKSAKERQQASDDSETQSEVLRILTGESQPLTEYGITKLSTYHKDRVRRAINALIDDDRIEIAETTQKPNGKIAIYYQPRRTVETDGQHGRSESGASVTQSEGMTVRTPKGSPPVCHTPRQTGDPKADGRDQTDPAGEMEVEGRGGG